MDGSIRCWSPGSGTPGAILNPEPEFTYVPDQDAPQQGRKHVREGGRGRGSGRGWSKVLGGSGRPAGVDGSGAAQPCLMDGVCSARPHLLLAPTPRSPAPGQPVLSMCATTDAAQASVLMVSFVADRSVRLLELPSFEGRGCLPKVRRCSHAAPARGTTAGRPAHRSGRVWAAQHDTSAAHSPLPVLTYAPCSLPALGRLHSRCLRAERC